MSLSGWVVPGRGAKLVVSPRGTLSSLGLEPESTCQACVVAAAETACLARADLLHATSEVELAEIRALGFTAPVAVIPNGIDLPDMPHGVKQRSDGRRTLLFLSRIHPTKGD